MDGKKSIIFLGILIVVLNCQRSRQPGNQEEQLLAFLLQDRPGVQNACESFIRTENLCVINGLNVVLQCNGTMQTRIRNGIQPENLRTDEILEKYFRCFTKCNQEFNVTSKCIEQKFSTNDIYRREQREAAVKSSGSSVGIASFQWIICYESCRSVNGREPPPDSGLQESQTTFPEDWFKVE